MSPPPDSIATTEDMAALRTEVDRLARAVRKLGPAVARLMVGSGEWLTTGEAARRMNREPAWVRSYVRCGDIEAMRVGGHWLIPAATVKKLSRAHRRAA
jgi:excisionase family DNA binding protein